jgi:hypothetical protein
MASHVKIVAILHIALGSLSILAGIAVLIAFGGIAGLISSSGDHDAVQAAPFVTGLGGLIFLGLAVLGVPGIIAGIGLLEFRSWGRILGIVISALDLIHFPFGTALGIYGLWALLSPEGEQLFRNPPQLRRPV